MARFGPKRGIIGGFETAASALATPHHVMLLSAPITNGIAVRTTIALDDALVAEAQALTNIREKTALLREALKALIQRESARRLARLGGTEPDIGAPPPRRRLPA